MKSGPKINPPPRPSKPPIIPAIIPIEQYRINCFTLQFVCCSPLEAITLFPLYKSIASYPLTPIAIGTWNNKGKRRNSYPSYYYIHFIDSQDTTLRPYIGFVD